MLNIKKLKAVLFGILLVSAIFTAATPAFAQIITGENVQVSEDGQLSPIYEVQRDPRALANNLIQISLMLLAIISLPAVIWGAYGASKFRGDKRKVKRARIILLIGIICLLIVVGYFLWSLTL